MNKVKILLACICLGLFSKLHAQNITTREYLTSITALPYVLDVEDDRYTDINSGAVNFDDKVHYGLLTLGFDDDLNICYQNALKIKATCQVTGKKYTVAGTLANISETIELEAEYSPAVGITYSDMSYKKLDNACSLQVSITSIELTDHNQVSTTITNPSTSLENDIYVEVTLVRERFFRPMYILPNYIGGTNFTSITLNNNENTVHLEWSQSGPTGKIPFPDEYEIEWGYVHNYTSSTISSSASPSSILFTFKNNSSRIRVKGKTSIDIKLMYDRGYLVFRIRGIWKGGPELDEDIYGNWNSGTNGNAQPLVLTTYSPYYLLVTLPGNTATKNWISSINFAEDGLHKPVVQYADGSGRVRQTVTSVSTEPGAATDRVSVVTETFYDHRGRPAIQTLPVPVLEEHNGIPLVSLQYFNNFNLKEGTSDKYSKAHFDVDGLDSNGDCVPEIPGFADSDGAGRYYSSLNGIGGVHRLVPDAFGFPFSHTVYTRDNTGRIRSQSGVGETHTTGRGHETVYSYNVPTQVELDRLFGTDVGYASHYKKNVIKDANGQYSISYLNMGGKVVATSLAGRSPGNVDALKYVEDGDPMYETDATDVNADLLNIDESHPYGLNNREINDGKGRYMSYTFSVLQQQEYIFDYKTIGGNFMDSCALDLCADCVYDLKITLTDRCGNNMLPNTLTHGLEYISYKIGGGLDTICNENDTLRIDSTHFRIVLAEGEYTITKELSLNMEAIEYYAQKFIENSTCLPTIDDFYVTPDSCYVDCELYPEECELQGPEYTRNYCQATYEIMLADMKPGGQYGFLAIDEEGQIDESDLSQYIVSVYTSPNLLPKKYFCGTSVNTCTSGTPTDAFWKNPRFKNPVTGQWETRYMDEDGVTESRIYVEIDANDQWSPKPDPSVVPATEPGTGLRFIRPHQLNKLSDFRNYFKYGAWEKSLVVYHPEYFYYEGCVELEQYTITVGSQQLNTWEYEEYISSTPIADFQSNIINGAGLKTHDPMFSGSGSPFPASQFMGFGPNMSTLMDGFINAYMVDGPNVYDMLSAAHATVHCGSTLNMATCLAGNPPGITVADEEVRTALVNFYIGRKQGLMNWYLNYYSLMKGSTTWCIDGGNIGISSSVLGTAVQPLNSCDLWKSIFYFDKQKRFVTEANVSDEYGFGDPADTEAMKEYADQVYFNETGLCPAARDLEMLIRLLANKGKLQSNQTAFSLTNGSYLTVPLAQLIDPGVDVNMTSVLSNADKTLTVTFNSIACPLVISFPAGSAYDFSHLLTTQGISIQPTFSGGVYTFGLKVVCAANNTQETVTLTATTCLPIMDCASGFKAVCKAKPLAYSIRTLMNVLSASGQLYTTSAYTLVSPVKEYIDPAIQTYIGTGTYTWIWNGTNKWTLTNTSNSKNLEINLNSSTGFTAGTSYTFAAVAPVNSTTPSNSTDNSLVLSAYQAGTPPIPGAGYPVTLNISITSSTYVGTIVTTSCQKVEGGSQVCKTQTHVNFDVFKELLESLVNNTIDPSAACMPTELAFMDGSSGFNWANVTQIFSVSTIMNSSSPDGVSSQYFSAQVLYGGFNRTIVGKWCKPMRMCEPCQSDGCNDDALWFEISMDQAVAGDLSIFPFCNGISTWKNFTQQEIDAIYSHTFQPGWTITDFFDSWMASIQAINSPGLQAFQENGKLYIAISKQELNNPDNLDCGCRGWAELRAYRMGPSGQMITDSVGGVQKMCCGPFRLTPPSNQYFDENDEPIITGTEWPPQDNLVFGASCNPEIAPFPGAEYVDNCDDQLIDLATLNAQNALQAYIDSVKADYKVRYMAHCMDNLENMTMRYTLNEYHFTLYYYDRAGNLVRTVPPRAVTPLPVNVLANVVTAREAHTHLRPNHNEPASASEAWALGTQYVYNSLNAVSAQHTPDAGDSRFWYDNLGRVVLSQNAKQRAVLLRVAYSYTLYDELGRIKEVGELLSSSAITEPVVKLNTSFASWLSAIPQGRFTEVTQTFYDDISTPPYIPSGFPRNNLRGRISTVLYKNVRNQTGPAVNSAIHYDYDFHGNVRNMLSENFDLQPINWHRNKVSYEYDLISGKVLKVLYNPTERDAFFHRYRYDEDNRLTEVQTSADQILWETDARYIYYRHRPLARIELGNKVQGLDYAYTIQGWFKGVNADNLSTDFDPSADGNQDPLNPYGGFNQDAFAYSLSYFNNDYVPVDAAVASASPFSIHPVADQLWNGNIRSMNTTIRKPALFDALPVAQTYVYDQLNRIRQSTAYNDLDLQTNVWAGTPLQAYATSYSYDQDGNILTLNRKGNNSTAYEMDQLVYDYIPNSNKLKRIEDNNGLYDNNYTADVDHQIDAVNYAYDEIGNLTQDLAEGIESIKWTVYGKVKKVTFTAASGKPDIEFAYNPMGVRISKKVTPKDNSPVKTTYYNVDAQGNTMAIYTRTATSTETYTIDEHLLYGSSRLGVRKNGMDLPSSVPSVDATAHPRGNKSYELNNHLSNVNMVVSDKRVRVCENGALVALQADIQNTYDYYPFGMLMPGRQFEVPNCRFDTIMVSDTIFFDDFSASTTDWIYMHDNSYPSVSGGNMLVNVPDKIVARFFTAEPGKTYHITVDVDMLGCSTIQAFTMAGVDPIQIETLPAGGGIYAFDWTAPDATGMVGFTVMPGCSLITVNSVLVETMGEQVVQNCENDSLPCNPIDTSLVTIYNNDASSMSGITALGQSSISIFEGRFFAAGGYRGATNFGFYAGIPQETTEVHTLTFDLSATECVAGNNIQVTVKDPSGNILVQQTYTTSGTYSLTYTCNASGTGTIEFIQISNCAFSIDNIVITKEEYVINPDCQTHSSGYRFGFNGKEKVDEVYGDANAYDFGARIYDPRIGRWLAVDPLTAKYPSLTPYNFSGNTPIMCKDPDGKKIVVYHEGKPYVYKPGVEPPAGSPDILFKVHEAAKYAMQTEIGAKVWNTVGDSHRVVNINFKDAKTIDDETTNKFEPYNVSGRTETETKLGDLAWDYNSRVIVLGGWDNEGDGNVNIGYQSPSTVLLHELGHAFLMEIALNYGLNSKEWKQYLENSNEYFGEDKQYDLKEEKIVTETIETPYIESINKIEEGKSYQRPRHNHKGWIESRKNDADVNKNPTKSQQQEEFGVPY
jgi:RHS repeat-associated protein